jgi:transcriptional regulator with XRE-family HTH domain
MNHVWFFMKTDKAFKNTLISVGNRLAELRLKKGYTTIKSFAQRYDLPEIQYWRIEKGKANITLKSLSRILMIHRVSLQDFFCLISEEKVAA